MNREEAIRAMLDGKKVRVPGWHKHEYCFYNTNEDNPFRFCHLDGDDAMSGVWGEEEWEIVQEPRKRPMTREEVLGFIEHSNVVVRKGLVTAWQSKYLWVYDGEILDYEYAYIDEKGNIGKPMKFEVEE